MQAKINQVGLITDKFDQMVAFYTDVLGFKVTFKEDGHAEFKSPGVRFAISKSTVMADLTGHSSFKDKKKGQAVELAFEVDNPADVDTSYNDIIAKGATAIKSAKDMPWSQRTAFFADPDGNIHEVFAYIPKK